MYRACMNTRKKIKLKKKIKSNLICFTKGASQALGLKPLTDLLENYGGWPITKNIQEVNFDWKSATASLRKLYRVSYLITVYNDLDSYDTEKSSIYVIHI